MKANGKRYSASWIAFLAISVVGCLIAGRAQAEPLFRGQFQLEHRIHWGNAVLEPGAYSLEVDRVTQTIVVSDAKSGKTIAREFARTDETAAGADSKLLISVQGNERAVYGLTIAGLGSVYQNAHPFAGVRVQEARNSEGVRVEVALK